MFDGELENLASRVGPSRAPPAVPSPSLRLYYVTSCQRSSSACAQYQRRSEVQLT
jgi:hypothetical protein